MRSLRIAAVALAIAGVVAGSSVANAHPRCEEVEATIYDKVVDVGCPPPTQVCVAGTFRGEHGFDGTSVFVLGSRGEAPPTAPGHRPVSGTITYTFKDGSTLSALETSIGNVDTTTGGRGRHPGVRGPAATRTPPASATSTSTGKPTTSSPPSRAKSAARAAKLLGL